MRLFILQHVLATVEVNHELVWTVLVRSPFLVVLLLYHQDDLPLSMGGLSRQGLRLGLSL
jgi:hypothetical protein